MKIALLTAGKDKPYALGIAKALLKRGIEIDFIGNSELEKESIFLNPNVTYYNLRGDQVSEVSMFQKIVRVLSYYWKLIHYAATTKTALFHILWLNKFFFFDSTLLNLFYKLNGKKLVYTAHNVNIKQRDGGDNAINRFSLRFLYNIVDHIFVHTKISKDDLIKHFNVNPQQVTVIPFGLNSTVPETSLDRNKAREALGLKKNDIVLLFFGNIAPYKGLDILVDAFKIVCKKYDTKLLIAGRIKGEEGYWNNIEKAISDNCLNESIIKRIEFIPDEEIEVYFKSADALVLPYRFIYQSGPLFLAYNFGLPVIANNVGQFKDDIIEGETGFVSNGTDDQDLADVIVKYIESDLLKKLDFKRDDIKRHAQKKYSWEAISEKIINIYLKVGPTFRN